MWGCFVVCVFRFPRERVILMAFRSRWTGRSSGSIHLRTRES